MTQRERRGARITAGAAPRLILPCECHLPSLHSFFMTVRLSAGRSTRTAGSSSSIPASSNSSGANPLRRPNSTRPSAAKPSVAISFGQDHRVAEVVVQHNGPHVEGGGRFGGHGSGYERPELGVKVVRTPRSRVTETLGCTGPGLANPTWLARPRRARRIETGASVVAPPLLVTEALYRTGRRPADRPAYRLSRMRHASSSTDSRFGFLASRHCGGARQKPML